MRRTKSRARPRSCRSSWLVAVAPQLLKLGYACALNSAGRIPTHSTPTAAQFALPALCHPFSLASIHFGKQLYHSLLSAPPHQPDPHEKAQERVDAPMSMNPSPYAGQSQSHPSPFRAGQCMNQSCLYAMSSKLCLFVS